MSTFVHVWCWTCDREIARGREGELRGDIANLVGAISKHRMDHGGIHDISITRQEETDGNTTAEE